jgi:hypothetical protein
MLGGMPFSSDEAGSMLARQSPSGYRQQRPNRPLAVNVQPFLYGLIMRTALIGMPGPDFTQLMSACSISRAVELGLVTTPR